MPGHLMSHTDAGKSPLWVLSRAVWAAEAGRSRPVGPGSATEAVSRRPGCLGERRGTRGRNSTPPPAFTCGLGFGQPYLRPSLPGSHLPSRVLRNKSPFCFQKFKGQLTWSPELGHLRKRNFLATSLLTGQWRNVGTRDRSASSDCWHDGAEEGARDPEPCLPLVSPCSVISK